MMRRSSRFPKLLGALALSSALSLVAVTATSAWAVDDRASQGQDRAAEAQADAAARQADNENRADNADLRGDNAQGRNDGANAGGAQQANANAGGDAGGAQQANPNAGGGAAGAGDTRGAETNPDGSKDPAGNNGTIKVDLLPFDDTGHNDTDTHSGCLVEIEFFGFDSNELVEVTFRGVAPTRTDGPLSPVREVPGDGDDAREVLDGDGVTGTGDATTEKLDDQQRYDLSAALAGVAPDRNGYHIRVEVDAVNAPGGAKTKVFWLDCVPTAAAAGAAGTTTTTGATTTIAGAADTTAAGAMAAGIAGETTANAAAAGESLTAEVSAAAEQVRAGAAETEQPRPERLEVKGAQFERGTGLARTGIPLALLVLTALGLVGAGTALRRAGRRRQESPLEA